MKTMAIAAIIAAALAGCGGNSAYRTVEPRGKYVGHHVPESAIAVMNGKACPLDELGLRIYIVGFTRAGTDGWIFADPVLNGLADDVRFADLPVFVAQVAERTEQTPATAPAGEGTKVSKNLIMFFDAEGAVKNTFLDAAPGQVFLLDWNGQVVAVTTLDKFGYLPEMAEQLGRHVRAWYTPDTDYKKW